MRQNIILDFQATNTDKTVDVCEKECTENSGKKKKKKIISMEHAEILLIPFLVNNECKHIYWFVQFH